MLLTFKGEINMRRLFLRMAMAVLGFAGLSITPNAQAADQVVVTVPFEFVIVGTTLPAGTYYIHRLSDDPSKGLVFSNYENHVIAAVLPTDVMSASPENPKLSFETAGGVHFLNRIQTANNVFDFPVSKAKFSKALAGNNPTSFGTAGK
jgi:hypothetical protein